jgi:hypothetical protein
VPAEPLTSPMRARDRTRGVRRPLRRAAGVTLVELLVATCVAATALGAAWPWVWNAGVTAHAQTARAQSDTSAAFALRIIRDDLAQATAVLAPVEGRAPGTALYLRHDHPGEPSETVAIVWDASRRVVWRKAPGTYLADRVDAFSVCYFHADGTQLLSGDFAASSWAASVARVSVSLCTRDGVGRSSATLEAVPGPA